MGELLHVALVEDERKRKARTSFWWAGLDPLADKACPDVASWEKRNISNGLTRRIENDTTSTDEEQAVTKQKRTASGAQARRRTRRRRAAERRA